MSAKHTAGPATMERVEELAAQIRRTVRHWEDGGELTIGAQAITNAVNALEAHARAAIAKAEGGAA